MFVFLGILICGLIIEYFAARLFFGVRTSAGLVFWTAFIPFVLTLAMVLALLICATYKGTAWWHGVGDTYLKIEIMRGWMSQFNNWDGTLLWKALFLTPFVFLANFIKLWFAILVHHLTIPMIITHAIALQIFYHTLQAMGGACDVWGRK